MSKVFIVHRIQLAVLILLSLLVIAPSAFAEVPVSITQQGRLLTADGEPMQGPKTLLFELYDAANDGEIMWGDEYEVDLGDSGFYTVILGSADNPLDHTVFQDGSTFMQLTIDSKPLLPRLELTSVPYAQIANFAKTAEHANTASSAITADHADTADSAITADHADTADSADRVKDGSITTASIADKAVTAEKIDSIPWSKISDQPTIPTYTGADFVTSNQNCSAGQMVTGISASGTLVCEVHDDENTTYTAGVGLVLNGTSFSIASGGVTDAHIVDMSWTKIKNKPEITSFSSSSFAKSNQGCSGTDVVVGFEANGTVRCGPPKDTTYTVQPGQGLSINNNQFGLAQGGIQTTHIANGAITSAKVANGGIQTTHIADGAITVDKIASLVTVYQVRASACDQPFGSISLLPACFPVQPTVACGLCGSPTTGTLRDGVVNCAGDCVCLSSIPQCNNQKLGLLISDSNP